MTTHPISAAQQFRAVAWLRWRLFLSGFRRKGGAGELAARIIVYPVSLIFLAGPMLGAGFGSYFMVRGNSVASLIAVFWVIFALQILVSINVSPPGVSFDPESLIRYPVTFTRYLAIRLFLGLLSASTIVGTMSLLSAALGVALADPRLGSIAFAAALVLALCNMMFVRMVFAWVDRWLSTRRARELMTFLIIVISLGIQYVNITFNGFGRHVSGHEQRAKIAAAVRFYHHIQPFLAALPPGQAATSIVNARQHAIAAAAFNLLEVLIAAAIFLGVFAWRMQREYRGENLSEVNHSPSPGRVDRAIATPRSAAGLAPASAAATTPFGLSPEVLASIAKEWIYLRRNPAQLYGLIIPLAMVFLFAARANTFARNQWIFPAAVAYSLLGVAALAYNSLGLDGPGIQFYFLAPVPIRTIFLAKNLFGFLINILQLVLIYLLLCFTSGAPSLLIAVTTICWAAFAALVNVTVGNMRSIASPKKIDPTKMSRRQASQMSGLLSLGLMVVAAGIGAGIVALSLAIGIPWLPIPILLTLDLGAFALYTASLHRLGAMVLNHRETLLEELTKVSV